MYSQKFWEWLVAGVLVIIAISLGFGLIKGQVDITQVVLALIGLIGIIRGASLKDAIKPPKKEEEDGKDVKSS